jgi:hypothetical protein
LAFGKKRSYGNILCEGSSTAYGFGDESGRMGYPGRLAKMCLDYNARPADAKGPCQAMLVHSYGQLDRILPDFIPNLRNHILEAKNTYYFWKSKMLGIFALDYGAEHIARKQGEEETYNTWRSALEELEWACAEYDVTPVVLSLLHPSGAKRADRIPVNLELRARLAALTEARVRSFEGDFIPYEQAIGGEDQRDLCLAEDGKHPNSLGYDRIASYMARIIEKEFEWPHM